MKTKIDIQIDLTLINDNYRQFIDYTIDLAKQNKINVLLTNTRQVPYDETGTGFCNGYFCDSTPELATACGQDFDRWFNVFIHESSHMDQWLEEDPVWTDGTIGNIESSDILDLWIHNYIELNNVQIQKVVNSALQVELNCERRTVEKIKQWNLPMNVEYYAQRANAHIWFYHYMGIVRKWYTICLEPYNISDIVSRMPTNLNGTYSTMPEDIKTTFEQYMRF